MDTKDTKTTKNIKKFDVVTPFTEDEVKTLLKFKVGLVKTDAERFTVYFKRPRNYGTYSVVINRNPHSNCQVAALSNVINIKSFAHNREDITEYDIKVILKFIMTSVFIKSGKKMVNMDLTKDTYDKLSNPLKSVLHNFYKKNTVFYKSTRNTNMALSISALSSSMMHNIMMNRNVWQNGLKELTFSTFTDWSTYSNER